MTSFTPHPLSVYCEKSLVKRCQHLEGVGREYFHVCQLWLSERRLGLDSRVGQGFDPAWRPYPCKPKLVQSYYNPSNLPVRQSPTWHIPSSNSNHGFIEVFYYTSRKTSVTIDGLLHTSLNALLARKSDNQLGPFVTSEQIRNLRVN